MTLDILSVQGNVAHDWSDRESRAFWRGRDSRMERLKLIEIARANPDLINASLTNFFFFRDKEAEYGPKQPYVSFYKFFDVCICFLLYFFSLVINHNFILMLFIFNIILVFKYITKYLTDFL